MEAVRKVATSGLDVFAHNVETVGCGGWWVAGLRVCRVSPGQVSNFRPCDSFPG